MTFEEFSLKVGQMIWRWNDRIVEFHLKYTIPVLKRILFLSKRR
jgi:hypothetical protein